ncbi:hypothetical protein [Acetobacter fallax]|uniref:Tetratricopeptide repeat protein n=1 Tax=Acetobacter fallax TaxID=1737473 RepID=A0ABX0K9G8_9PROT|nr:hypothetical protein [Acetobacter fallax]NHO33052.1 hypothetical protein [Acetobacter fallax]NHO36702.1 hypothetical protein [Acetobacter fallax]
MHENTVSVVIEDEDDIFRQLNRAEKLAASGETADAINACVRAEALLSQTKRLRDIIFVLLPEADAVAQSVLLELLTKSDNRDDVQDAKLADFLCQRGAFEDALPFLRRAAPRLRGEYFSAWNYIRCLEETGRFDELIDCAALLDDLAARAGGTVSLYSQLANARLAKCFDRTRLVSEIEALEMSVLWMSPEQVFDRIRMAVTQSEAFSVVSLGYNEARLIAATSLRANILLSSPETVRIINLAWTEQFGELFLSCSPALIAQLGRTTREGGREAGILCLPGAGVLAQDNPHFGFFAVQDREMRAGRYGAFAEMNALALLASSDPGLRNLLAGQPFLGVVSGVPGLASRIGDVCGVTAVTEYLLRAPETGAPLPADATIALADDIWVPFPGAIFVIAAGLLGPYVCERVRQSGGIALDVSKCLSTWDQ